MKRKIIPAIIMCLPLAFLLNTSIAQSDYVASANIQTLKNILTYYTAGLDQKQNDASSTIPNAYVNDKVLKSFNKNFKNASTPTWYVLDKGKNYLAYFNQEGRKSKAMFTKNGYVLYSISDATEKNLPKSTRVNIKSNYVDYDITNLQQINTLDTDAWIATLKDASNFIVLSEVNGNLYELQNYTTAPEKVSKKKSRVIIGKTENEK